LIETAEAGGMNIYENYFIKQFQKWSCPVWWCIPTIPALKRLRQEDCEFQTRLGYLARLCLKQTNKKSKTKIKNGWASVAHACNPSYSRRRDQEDHGSKLAWANSLGDPYLEKTHYKRAGGM
jgi:hypothetical protein